MLLVSEVMSANRSLLFNIRLPSIYISFGIITSPFLFATNTSTILLFERLEILNDEFVEHNFQSVLELVPYVPDPVFNSILTLALSSLRGSSNLRDTFD